MKISEFIEYLQSLPEQTKIYVLHEVSGGYASYCEFKPIDIDVNIELLDMRGNIFAKSKKDENSVSLLLGAK